MKTLIAAAAVALSLMAAQAHAASYTFSFSGTNPNSNASGVFSGTLTTNSTGASQLITSLTGTFNGAAAILRAVGSSPYPPSNDNLFYPGATGQGFSAGTKGYLDGSGIDFSAGGLNYSFYYDGKSSAQYQLASDSSETNFYNGDFTASPAVSAVSAAPEPGSWALMLGGVGVIGALIRVASARRREYELRSIASA